MRLRIELEEQRDTSGWNDPAAAVRRLIERRSEELADMMPKNLPSGTLEFSLSLYININKSDSPNESEREVKR